MRLQKGDRIEICLDPFSALAEGLHESVPLYGHGTVRRGLNKDGFVEVEVLVPGTAPNEGDEYRRHLYRPGELRKLD